MSQDALQMRTFFRPVLPELRLFLLLIKRNLTMFPSNRSPWNETRRVHSAVLKETQRLSTSSALDFTVKETTMFY